MSNNKLISSNGLNGLLYINSSQKNQNVHQNTDKNSDKSNENSIDENINKNVNKKNITPIITPITSNISNNTSNNTSNLSKIQNIKIPENLFHLMELLTNLKLLSHVKQNDKLTCDIKNDIVSIDSRYYLQGIRRWICGDTRNETINFIDKLVVSAEYLSENLILSKNTDDKHNLKILTEDLISSKNGLNNLKLTYSEDKLLISRVENYLEKIKLRIDKNNKYV
jgi:hypothetical protein